MAEFVESLSSLELPSCIDVDIMSHFEQLNGNIMGSFNFGSMDFSNDNFLPFLENLPGILPVKFPKPDVDEYMITVTGERGRGDKKRKLPASETNSINSSATTTETVKKNRSSGSGKRLKRGKKIPKEKVEDKKEVVHVRARRGQATDSHSLAERVRREKINEKMRCLQSLVPGCYKAMGMAGVLDEIINYVQSLQNQVEFLSLKLTAASSPNDFILDIEAMASQQMLQGDGDSYVQAEAMEILLRENGDYGECSTSFQSTMPF